MVQQNRERYRLLFEATLDRESELKGIKLAFERMKKSLPDAYEQDMVLLRMSEELEAYLRGISQLIKVLRSVRSVFYSCQCLTEK